MSWHVSDCVDVNAPSRDCSRAHVTAQVAQKYANELPPNRAKWLALVVPGPSLNGLDAPV